MDQPRDHVDLALFEPIDLVDHDDDVDPALVELADKLSTHMVQSLATRGALPHRVETSRGGPAIAQQYVVGRGNAFGIPEQGLSQALQLFGSLTARAFGARLERRHRFGEKGMNQAVARVRQTRVEPDDDGGRVVLLGSLRHHVEDGRLAGAACPGEAQDDAGCPPFGVDQRAEESSDELLVQ